MSGFARLLVRILAVCLLCTAAAAEAGFDPPLAKTVVRTTMPPMNGSAPDTPISVTVTCAYYQGFMLKTTDGDPNWPNRIVVVHGEKIPCMAKNPGERPIWWGRFRGVKGGYIFFNSGNIREHGEDDSTILDSTGRMVTVDDKIGPFESIRIEAGALVLRFRRTAGFSCSLYYGAATGCWGEIKAKTGLTDASTPQCRDAYEALIVKYKEKHWDGVQRVWDHAASVTYNVEERIDGRKITYTARPGPAECWPTY